MLKLTSSLVLLSCLAVFLPAQPRPSNSEAVSQAEHERLRGEFEAAQAQTSIKVAMVDSRLTAIEMQTKANAETLNDIHVTINRAEGIGISVGICVLILGTILNYIYQNDRKSMAQLATSRFHESMDVGRQTKDMVNGSWGEQLQLQLHTAMTLHRVAPTPETKMLVEKALDALRKHEG